MRYEHGHKERMRERLLSEAASVIRSDGPERLSVATLMKRAGLTHGGFYVHFKSKDDLVAEAIDHMFVQRQAFMASIDRTDARAALDQIVDSYLVPKQLDAFEDACPIPLLAGEHHRLPEAARRRITLGVERLRSIVEELLARTTIDPPEDTVDSVVAELIGASALGRIQASDDDGRKFLAAVRRSVRAKLGLDR